MLSQVRRGHHQEFDGNSMTPRPLTNHEEQWKYSERANSSLIHNNILPDAYPRRSNSTTLNPDLSRALRVDAHLLAIIRIEDKRNNYYSAEVVTKLRQKEQTQSFINKPCSLFVNERSLFIYDRMTQTIAETIPLEQLDPQCVQSDTPDTLNDIFMYRLLDRNANSTHRSNSHEFSTVVVFKCSNKESKVLVDCIRSSNMKQLKQPRSARSQTRSHLDRSTAEAPLTATYDPQSFTNDSTTMNNQTYVVGPQYPRATHHATASTTNKADYYKRLTEELNKCFDDIELFVHHVEVVTNYTKEIERDTHRRKEKKSSAGTKPTVEKLPDDRYFIDVLQKFKHSFNLIGELKHLIHNPNGPELVHYLLTPLQFILLTLRQKHPNQSQLAQDIWSPPLIKDARELLLNCLTSRENETFRNLGPAWIRTAEETPQRTTDYRPVFYEGRPPWIQDGPNEYPTPSARSTTTEERQATTKSSARPNVNNHNNAIGMTSATTTPRQPSPSTARQFDSSTIDRSARTATAEVYNSNMQNEHAWAIERKRAGSKICAVKLERTGQNSKELTVRRGELIEILDSSRKWWRAQNFLGEIGHVPHNIIEEIDIEQRSARIPPTNPSAPLPRASSVPIRGYPDVNGRPGPYRANPYGQYLIRSPSNGENFILQSNNGTSMKPTIIRDEFFRPTGPSVGGGHHPPPPPPISTIPSPPPPPPAPPLPADFSNSRTSPWSTLQLPDSSRKQRSRMNTSDLTPRNEELQQELAQRITDRAGVISAYSTKEDVQRWLASKPISPELIQKLRNFNGEQLFQLMKSDLDRMTNEVESTRLFNLLLQQKQLSGYKIKHPSEQSNTLNNSGFSSLKASTLRDADDSFSSRPNDSLSRSLKIKLKQQRDKIDKAETVARTVL